jgi:hypothetical protein
MSATVQRFDATAVYVLKSQTSENGQGRARPSARCPTSRVKGGIFVTDDDRADVAELPILVLALPTNVHPLPSYQLDTIAGIS